MPQFEFLMFGYDEDSKLASKRIRRCREELLIIHMSRRNFKFSPLAEKSRLRNYLLKRSQLQNLWKKNEHNSLYLKHSAPQEKKKQKKKTRNPVYACHNIRNSFFTRSWNRF